MLYNDAPTITKLWNYKIEEKNMFEKCPPSELKSKTKNEKKQIGEWVQRSQLTGINHMHRDTPHLKNINIQAQLVPSFAVSKGERWNPPPPSPSIPPKVRPQMDLQRTIIGRGIIRGRFYKKKMPKNRQRFSLGPKSDHRELIKGRYPDPTPLKMNAPSDSRIPDRSSKEGQGRVLVKDKIHLHKKPPKEYQPSVGPVIYRGDK